MPKTPPTIPPPANAIRAVIFDLDGLLIDSEPHWRKAEMEIFATLGVPLSEAECVQTTGLRIDEVVAYWHERRPWQGASPGEVAARIIDALIRRIRSDAMPKPGIAHAFGLVRARGLPVGLASSSARRIIDAACERLGLTGAFDAIHSAEHERYGKPHPAVYLHMAEQLGVMPTACLAIEDSLNGLIAAKAARMRCLAVPEDAHVCDPRFALADAVIPSLEALDDALWQQLDRDQHR